MNDDEIAPTDIARIMACTVSRDVQDFDLLIEDMETVCGEAWGDLSLEDAAVYLRQPEADSVEFVAVAIDGEDEDDIATVADLIKVAVSRQIKVLVIAEEVSPIALHQLLRLGATEFLPYPLPEGALPDAVMRLRSKAVAPAPAEPAATPSVQGDRDGMVLAVHGLAGGTGATTFAVNLAWELARIDPKTPPRVCLLDLDLQFGSVATYLDLPRRESVLELLSDTAAADGDSFLQALLPFRERLHVLTSPADLIPLDLVGADEIQKILDLARGNFDYVVIDMPKTFVTWTETVLSAARAYFAPIELDMRSAQNILRVIRALKSEELPYERVRPLLNRAPKFTDLSGRARVKRMAESLDIEIDMSMPDGGRQVAQAGDHGIPLAEIAAKNPLRKEIEKLARSLHEQAASTKTAA